MKVPMRHGGDWQAQQGQGRAWRPCPFLVPRCAVHPSPGEAGSPEGRAPCLLCPKDAGRGEEGPGETGSSPRKWAAHGAQPACGGACPHSLTPRSLPAKPPTAGLRGYKGQEDRVCRRPARRSTLPATPVSHLLRLHRRGTCPLSPRTRRSRGGRRCLTCTLVSGTSKNLPATQETWVRSLGWEVPREKRMATHSSILA